MASMKATAITLSEKLATLEVENGISPTSGFHVALSAALKTHQAALGFTDADIADINAAGAQVRADAGGAPKEPPTDA